MKHCSKSEFTKFSDRMGQITQGEALSPNVSFHLRRVSECHRGECLDSALRFDAKRDAAP
ncbi:hypothetical protein ATO1_25350 [Phaeobacter sp. 22II1-1F12B]|nr:hypothetical protein ATO1_25350 [Phaeobacter sp. 22II1-1F12B]